MKQYLQHLCDDLASLLLPRGAGRALMVTGMNVKLPTALGIPLGFIVSELITNSSKYAKGDTTVESKDQVRLICFRYRTMAPACRQTWVAPAVKGSV